ncbi:MAG: mRNA surveillance protein pelota [Candidatus Hodarchaeota archaeon]
MKIVTKKLRIGLVVVVPEDMDDLWHLYNIILPGDQVAARTVRRVRRDSDDSSRPDKGERRPMFIRLTVEEVALHKYSNRLRVKGRILEGPEDFVSTGTYHTINVEPGVKVEITKESWPRPLLRRIEDATKRRGQRLIVIAVEEDQASIGIIDDSGVDVRVEVHGTARGKYGKYIQSADAFSQMFASIATQLRELLTSLTEVLHIVIVGPGSTKEKLSDYLQNHVPASKGRVVLEHTSTGTVGGIYEALNRGIIERLAGEIRLNREIQLIDEVLQHLGKGTGKTAYGWQEIRRAVQFGAIETLLILDKLFREAPPEQRRELESIMRQVEDQAGTIELFSAEHHAGKQLQGLGGLAALLRFSLPFTKED